MSQSSSSWLGHTDFSNSIVRDDTSDGASGEHPRAPGPAGAGLAAADIAGQTAAGAEMTAVWPEERPSPDQVGGQDPRTLSLHSAMDAWARINPLVELISCVRFAGRLLRNMAVIRCSGSLEGLERFSKPRRRSLGLQTALCNIVVLLPVCTRRQNHCRHFHHPLIRGVPTDSATLVCGRVHDLVKANFLSGPRCCL